MPTNDKSSAASQQGVPWLDFSLASSVITSIRTPEIKSGLPWKAQVTQFKMHTHKTSLLNIKTKKAIHWTLPITKGMFR